MKTQHQLKSNQSRITIFAPKSGNRQIPLDSFADSGTCWKPKCVVPPPWDGVACSVASLIEQDRHLKGWSLLKNRISRGVFNGLMNLLDILAEVASTKNSSDTEGMILYSKDVVVSCHENAKIKETFIQAIVILS